MLISLKSAFYRKRLTKKKAKTIIFPFQTAE